MPDLNVDQEIKPTAWLLEPPRQDITALSDRYTVRFIFNDRMKADSWRDDIEGFYEYMQTWSSRVFIPRQDYFVLTGNLTMIVAATLALAKRFPSDRLMFLRYDHGKQSYCETSLAAEVTEAHHA